MFSIFLLTTCFDIDALEEDTAYCPTPVTDVYNREINFGGWIDEDGDGEDTRLEVLIEENIGSQDFVFENNTKKFRNPLWLGPYSGLTFDNPTELDIDHVVPLKEAWISGACFWDDNKRIRYNNFLADTNHLMAVQSSLNRQKSDKDPVNWLPPNILFKEKYILYWTQIKVNWGLTVDQEEYDFLIKELGNKVPDNLKITTCECQ